MQKAVQYFLLVLAILCIPWLLALKPYILYQQHKRKLKVGYKEICLALVTKI